MNNKTIILDYESNIIDILRDGYNIIEYSIYNKELLKIIDYLIKNEFDSMLLFDVIEIIKNNGGFEDED